jgi:hypothetical protein
MMAKPKAPLSMGDVYLECFVKLRKLQGRQRKNVEKWRGGLDDDVRMTLQDTLDVLAEQFLSHDTLPTWQKSQELIERMMQDGE